MNVISVKQNPRDIKQGFVRLSDGTEAWTPEYALVESLVGKPVPDGWLLKDNKAGTGKVFLPPKQGGGGGYRNSKEAFDREAESRAAWQQVEEERRDRRTALMQAVAMAPEAPLFLADTFYTWLRAPRGAKELEGKDSKAPRETTSVEVGGTTSKSAQGATFTGTTSPPVQATEATDSEAHAGGDDNSGGHGQTPAEAAVGGDGSSPGAKPLGRRYPNAVSKCSHEYAGTEDGRCGGCGRPLEKLEAS